MLAGLTIDLSQYALELGKHLASKFIFFGLAFKSEQQSLISVAP